MGVNPANTYSYREILAGLNDEDISQQGVISLMWSHAPKNTDTIRGKGRFSHGPFNAMKSTLSSGEVAFAEALSKWIADRRNVREKHKPWFLG